MTSPQISQEYHFTFPWMVECFGQDTHDEKAVIYCGSLQTAETLAIAHSLTNTTRADVFFRKPDGTKRKAAVFVCWRKKV